MIPKKLNIQLLYDSAVCISEWLGVMSTRQRAPGGSNRALSPLPGLTDSSPKLSKQRILAQALADAVPLEPPAPSSHENFHALSTGEKGFGCKGSCFYGIILGLLSESIYGEKFNDENFILKHPGPGVSSMANAGPNTNSSWFFLCTTGTELKEGMNTVEAMECFGSRNGKTSKKITIADCGQIK
ncbi:unnamed protein product [Nyctereutes procyonoides]|uniref:Peptidyl-prolyl cis-trans isomerase n=1 Tax=Nyctereutes procyonoides TaxID=34880 RepID=A0A812A022_NYCPR|nr:unnamed protein product [Nyctereutes procyonoides]